MGEATTKTTGVRVGDRVWFYTRQNFPPGEAGVVRELRPTEWGSPEAVIAPDSRPERPVYLFEGAMYGFEAIVDGACPACNGSPGQAHRHYCRLYPGPWPCCHNLIVGRESEGLPDYSVSPESPRPMTPPATAPMTQGGERR
jgi:hypothetical protein